jgi:hypothetical protein
MAHHGPSIVILHPQVRATFLHLWYGFAAVLSVTRLLCT